MVRGLLSVCVTYNPNTHIESQHTQRQRTNPKTHEDKDEISFTDDEVTRLLNLLDRSESPPDDNDQEDEEEELEEESESDDSGSDDIQSCISISSLDGKRT